MSRSSESPQTWDLGPHAATSEPIKQSQSNETETQQKEPEKRGSEPIISDQSKNEPSRPEPIQSVPEEAGPSEDTTRSSPGGTASPKKMDKVPPEEQTDEVIAEEKPSATGSLRRTIVWTMTSFFDWNPMYLVQMRGICNVLQVLMNLIVIILLSINCQLHTILNGPSEGFFCQPPETFLFSVSVGAFLTSIIYLFCCLLSKKTERLLFQTSFEVCYFALYFILLLTSSSALLVSAISWGTERMMYGNDYDLTHSAAIIGLINSIVYGLSAVCYFINQRYIEHSSQSLNIPA